MVKAGPPFLFGEKNPILFACLVRQAKNVGLYQKTGEQFSHFGDYGIYNELKRHQKGLYTKGIPGMINTSTNV
jgi:hypothetical protein